ncbi:unnamed protein product [Rotaria sordida]|uniref:Uncharacterized protein n=1 Tax=Rotaria sordida TaxID=392033 RepID=A0A815L6G9_9BILA|nr:unnamed protein product [Rotaria sordida]
MESMASISTAIDNIIQRTNEKQPTITLFDYIGKHKWMGKSIVDDSSISSENILYALQNYITQDLPLVNQGENHSEALKKELKKTESVGLVEMVSNSGLLSYICTICFSQLNSSSLPTQHILLYELVVKPVLNLWRSKILIIDTSKVIRILTDIAFYIHQNSTSNHVDNEEIKEVCAQTVQTSINKTLLTTEDIHNIERQASEMAQVICNDAGILAS